MPQTRCPSCGEAVSVDLKRLVRGVLRLKCDTCSHRFLLQVNRKELRLEQETPTKAKPEAKPEARVESYSFER